MAPAPAFAGAWIAPEGGQEIWTNVAGVRSGMSYFESSGYLEAPVADDTSIVAAPWAEQNYDTQDGWRGEATLGVKRTIFRGGDAVMALQAGALWMSHPSESDCGEGGVELRWLGGRSFDSGGFVNIEAAGRVLESGCEARRVDLTAGYRPTDNWLLMGQVFFDAPREAEESVKAQITFVRFGENGRGLQIGVRARVDGGEPEPALVIGLWGRPGD